MGAYPVGSSLEIHRETREDGDTSCKRGAVEDPPTNKVLAGT